MANYRQIHVSIWKDEWFLDLEPQAKLLFIYLFSNESTSLAGIYKLPIKVIEFETGLDLQYIIDTLSEFELMGKVHYQDGIVWVVKMRRYHETKSPKVLKRINDDIASIPDCPLKIQYQYSMDTKLQLKEEEEEKEDEEEEEEQISDMQASAEKLIGLPASYNDMQTLREWEQLGVIEQDIRDALAWRKENGHSPIKTISQLSGGVSFARNKRVQGTSAHSTRDYTAGVPDYSEAEEADAPTFTPAPEYFKTWTAFCDTIPRATLDYANKVAPVRAENGSIVFVATTSQVAEWCTSRWKAVLETQFMHPVIFEVAA